MFRSRNLELIKAAKYEMRYKSPQPAVQHCFMASFGSMFLVFHLSCRATNVRFKKCRDLIGWFAWCRSKASCEFDGKRTTKPRFVAQSRHAFDFSQQLSSTRSKKYCCARRCSREVKNAKLVWGEKLWWISFICLVAFAVENRTEVHQRSCFV